MSRDTRARRAVAGVGLVFKLFHVRVYTSTFWRCRRFDGEYSVLSSSLRESSVAFLFSTYCTASLFSSHNLIYSLFWILHDIDTSNLFVSHFVLC